MSWLGRLFGRAPVAPPPPPATAVTIPDDVAAALTADGSTLGGAVESALRLHIAARERAAAEGRVPFWLARDDEHGDAIEEALRDRLAQRRSADEGPSGAPTPGPDSAA